MQAKQRLLVLLLAASMLCQCHSAPPPAPATTTVVGVQPPPASEDEPRGLCETIDGSASTLFNLLEEPSDKPMDELLTEGIACLAPNGSVCERVALRKTLLASRSTANEAPDEIRQAATRFVSACEQVPPAMQACLRVSARLERDDACLSLEAEKRLYALGGYSPSEQDLANPEMCQITRERPGDFLLELSTRYPFASPMALMSVPADCDPSNTDVCDRAASELSMMPSMAVADGVVGPQEQQTYKQDFARRCRQLTPAEQRCLRSSYAWAREDECGPLRAREKHQAVP